MTIFTKSLSASSGSAAQTVKQADRALGTSFSDPFSGDFSFDFGALQPAANLTKTVGKLCSTAFIDPFTSDFSFSFGPLGAVVGLVKLVSASRGAGSAQAISVPRALSHALALIEGSATRLLKLVGAIRGGVADASGANSARQLSVIRGAAEANTTGLVRLTSALRRIAAIMAEGVTLPAAHYRLFGAVDADSANSVRLASIIRGVAAANATGLARLFSVLRGVASTMAAHLTAPAVHYRLLSAGSPDAAILVRTIAIAKAVAAPGAIAMQRLVSAIRGGVDTNRAFVIPQPPSTRFLPAIFSSAMAVTRQTVAGKPLAQAETLFSRAGILHIEQPAVLGTNVASTITGMVTAIRGVANVAAVQALTAGFLLRAFGAVDGNSAGLARLSSLIRGAATTIAITIPRHISSSLRAADGPAAGLGIRQILARVFGTTTVEVAVAQRAVSRLSSGTTVNAARLIRQPGKALAFAWLGILSLARGLQAIRSAATAQAATILTPIIRTRTAGAASAAAAYLARAMRTSLGATTTTATLLARVLLVAARTVQGQVANRLLALPRRLSLIQASTVYEQDGLFWTKIAGVASLQATAAATSSGLRNLVINAATSGVAALAHGFVRPFATFSRMVARVISWPHQFRGRASFSRLVRLPPPQTLAAMPGSIRRVRLPREEEEMTNFQIHRAEPPYFSPFDPSDQDTFAFDWSIRGYANDIITFATVTSIPAGVNFVGPAFIDGTVVSATIGSFTPPQLPMTYTLRCTAVFASGRISSYSVPFQVQSL